MVGGDASIFSAWHHQRSNRNTSQRIKRTHRSRFMNGGCLSGRMYGWLSPAGAKTDAEVTRDPAAERIYKEWFRLLDEENASFAEVVRWLTGEGVRFPTRTPSVYADPYGALVARYTFNSLLKGNSERNRRKTKRVNDRGKYVPIKANPDELLQRNVPHLAFFEAAYYDRIVAGMKDRDARYRRSDVPAHDPCRGRPRRQARLPARVTVCDICGRQFVWGGHGQTDHLMCNGVRLHRC